MTPWYVNEDHVTQLKAPEDLNGPCSESECPLLFARLFINITHLSIFYSLDTIAVTE